LARDKVAGRKNSLPRGDRRQHLFHRTSRVGPERIVRFAKLVGKENDIACTDCGLRHLPDASLAFAKLYALAEGAQLATRELWRG
jgi:hypothetical protein